MTDTTVALFIDTNSFLQMKDFNQIAWRALFPEAETIRLFVCSAIITELDKHKVSSNQRRRNRARAALRQIEETAASPAMTLVVKEAAPKVEIVIWRGKLVWSDFPDLDPNSADDYLVAAASTAPNGVVLSHDTGPRIRARIAGVRAACPPDDWLLPAEQTDDQRKIGQLSRELEAAQNARPRLQIALPTDDPIRMRGMSVPYLGTKAVHSLTVLILKEFPQRGLAASSYRDRFSVLSDPYRIGQTQIDAYAQDYESFSSDVQAYFTKLHERVEQHALAQMPPGAVVNIGNVSAKNLILTIETEGDIELLADRDAAESVRGRISLPEAPKPPRPGPVFDPVPLMSAVVKPRDSTGFYWRTRPPLVGARLASFECADYRPAREEDLGVLVHAVGDLPSSGRLIVSVSAEHHETVTEGRGLIFERGQGDWLDPLVQGLLPEIVQEAFASLDSADVRKW